MAFSTSNAKRQSLSPELRDWCANGSSDERRTVLLRLFPGTDVDQLAMQLDDLGAAILSLGESVTVADMTCQVVREASELPGVISIDAPSQMFPKSGR